MGDDDWDLHAVVRGCGGGQAAAATRDPFSSFMAAGEGRDFSNLFENRYDVPVLEEVCRPFFNRPLVSPQRREPSPVSTSPASGAVIGGAAAAVPSARHPNRRLSQNPRSKRRKNQQKRVVCEISATDAATSDMWAWRKYGQKPIKGSPYPRGYYRCSSSKGCLARKQVERSRTDPNMLIITYTAEHNHAVPTHRNSLAGSTRQKFPAGDRRAVSENISSSPPSSLTAVVSMEEGEQEEESEEGVLLVEDMEVLDEGNVLFMEGGGGLDGFGDVGFDFLGCEEQAFDWPWLGADSKGNGNAAAAAGGS